MNKLSIFILSIITFCTLSAKSEILYPEPDKDRNSFAADLFNIKCSISPASHHQIYLCAIKNMNSGDKEKKEAIASLKKLASEGVLDAQYTLYASRKNSGISEEEAYKYLIASAQGGFAVAQARAAQEYLQNNLPNSSIEEAYKWSKEAAKNNNYDGMKMLSLFYFSGKATEQDDKLGFYWINKTYNLYGRYFDDWGLLGKVYETGRGTPVDLVKAYMYYDLEGTAGIEEKARIAPKMTAEQRAEGLRLSHEWQEKNHVYTMQSLGLSRQKDGSYR